MDTQGEISSKQTKLFGSYQIGSNSRDQAIESVLESPFTAPLGFTNHEIPAFSQVPSASPPTNELASCSLRSPKCPECKGKRFDFTAYFHNPKFFPAPPHELLDLIERSYVLKNRLQSLLVTYIVHDLREVHMMQDSRTDIQDWLCQVVDLGEEVRRRLGKAEGVESGLVGVQAWTEAIANQLREHVERSRNKKLEAPKGWKKELLSEFRKEWETVWIACANAYAYHHDITPQ